MLRVWLMPATYGPRKAEAIAERTNVVKAHFCKDFCAGNMADFSLMLEHSTRVLTHASLLYEMEFDFDETPLCLASLPGRNRVVVGCKNYTLKVIDLNSKSIMSSCCTNLPDQSVRNFGSRKPVGLYGLQVACDEKGYVVVGSCTNMALSVFIEGAGQLSVLHTFKINDYYVTSSMCLDNGLVLLCCQTKNFLVADYGKGVVLKRDKDMKNILILLLQW